MWRHVWYNLPYPRRYPITALVLADRSNACQTYETILELDKVALPEGLSMEILLRDPNYNLKTPILVDPRLKYIGI